jgi:hypothetical protein
MDYGFPGEINVTLKTSWSRGCRPFPEGDEAEFKSFVQKANDSGLAPRSGDPSSRYEKRHRRS